ncbi:hypothetical protein J3R30DRAFT_3527068 [Lentinula aciculospora]|uniref:Uncharacterized protein n=1 Tax=Lentinula aciculospora TaxID=153920 RepID=A0A9W9A0M4_9AGAR|nr:hypothetical protein J3R30DRAFT_3527068 [Lentinula aciculospora]
MASSSSSQSPPNQQQTQPRGPAFAKWPTVKIFMPPQGRFSPKRDEWCITYCTQSITGRIHAAQPSCTTLCIRKVFEHEVRNVTGFKRHEMNVMGDDDDTVEAAGSKDKDKGVPEDNGKGRKVVRKKAVYALPPEGQPENVPKIFGGASSNATNLEANSLTVSTTPIPTTPMIKIRSWSPGYYLFTSMTIYGTFEHLASMSRDIPRQVARQKKLESMKREWIEYQEWTEKLQRGEIRSQEAEGREERQQEGNTGMDGNAGQTGEVDERNFLGPKRPPQPPPDYLSSTLLVPLPPASLSHLTSQLTSHILSPMSKFLKPSGRALELLRNDLQGGTYQQFASRVFSKAQTDEPAKLARRSWERLLEAWKGDGGDGKDGGIKG